MGYDLYITEGQKVVEIQGIIWLDSVVDKIESKHNVWPWEVEEALSNNPEIRRGTKREHPNENLYYALGRTDAGRYLFIVFANKQGNALIITAREMTQTEKQGFKRRNPNA
jgi:uncharacterized DUF497 family protein